MTTPQFAKGLVPLLKQGWNEIPEVMASGAAALCAVVGSFYVLHLYEKKGLENKRYKQKFVIMRPDDPRVAKIHKD